MKRFWLLALLMAGSLAMALVSPAFAAKMGSEDEGGDSSETLEDVNSAMGSMSSHMNDIDKALHLKVSGDVRLRYAFITQNGSQAGVTIPDSSRGRYRARLGASIKRGDFTGKFRIATGSSAAPFSQNNTFDTAMSNPSILIDTASITWDPSFSNGMLSITGGKMANPLTKTSITWDPDIQPEGVDVEIKKDDFVLRATYFELQNLVASGNVSMGNIDLFMDNVQAEYTVKMDTDTSVGIMAGYEYIPNSTFIASQAATVGQNGVLTKNAITGFGGVLDPGAAARDWNNVEGMLTFKHKMGDVPFKWYVHVTDNLNGLNLPDPSQTSGHSTKFTNQYAWLGGVDIGATKAPGDFAGTLYMASLDPNCTLPWLVDDDPGETNRQYLFGSLSCLAEDGVTLKLSEWLVNREYYAGGLGGTVNALAGSSQNPESVTYVDCIVNL